MKKILLSVLLAVSIQTFSQNYQPNWESLDARPVPEWFRDAKFGIFIHWGVYAVPGWCTKGNYAEWYQYGLQTTDTARQRFHKEKFGNLSYYQLADQFKAELFKPDEWAKVFEQSGAKYIVLTSKHHDGYTLWPDQTANKTWGFPWNAAEVGPKRDLLGDLFTAVRKTSVRAGMYYSLYEWFNPLWKADQKRYANEHVWPQMNELINKYQPDVFWTDGDWDAPAETWRSQEFLAWLYNSSPVKDKIVVNDRWGAGIRFQHAGIYTPEYQPDLDFEDHYWEESRGMGFSYGYNREEDAWDYNSTQSLVLQLVDKASRGGNFLLDIGPDEHGKIPPIMQERLLQIGEWLKVNGDAIYNTVRWRIPSQWSEGRKDYKPVHGSGDLLLKLTIDPEPGYAVKELFFTYNQKNNDLYAIFPKYPSNRKLLLRNVTLNSGTSINFLSTGEKLLWKQQGNDIEVQLPEYDPNKIKSPYAYAIRIRNFGKFAPRPKISVSYSKALQPLIAVLGMDGTTIRYTTDGTEPTDASNLYSVPFTITKSSEVKVKAFLPDAFQSATASQFVHTYEWKKALKVNPKNKGLTYKTYELTPKLVADIDKASAIKSGTTTEINLANITRNQNAGLRFEGYIKIEKDGLYGFDLSSDDGSKLWIDDEVVVDHDGIHGSETKNGKIALRKGYHRIKLDFIQASGNINLSLTMNADGLPKQSLPASMLFH